MSELPSDETQPTVFVVDDEPAARKSVCALVGSFGLQSEAFASGEEFLEAYDASRPGCLVTDVRMLEMSGVELQEKLIRDNIDLPVIVITAHAETSLTVRAMKNGAITLLEKPCREHELWEAIGHAIAKDAASREREQLRQEMRARFERLSESEAEVLQMIVEGMLNKQIASELDVSVRTVESRRRNIFEKTGTSSVAELVQLVLRLREE